MIDVLRWLVRWTRRASSIDFGPTLAALVSPVRNIIFLTGHFFTFLVPIAQQPGQAGVLGRLSLCLWFCFTIYYSRCLQAVILVVLTLKNI
jgi:hypothetical protein